MDPLRILVLTLHISAAALLIGVPTGLVRNLKSSLKLGKPAFENAAQDAVRRGAIVGGSSILTLATGLVLIFMAGGFGQVAMNFHIALVVMLVALVVASVVVRPAGTKLLALAQAADLDQQAALTQIRKQAMGTGILHLLWLVNLLLMLVRIY